MSAHLEARTHRFIVAGGGTGGHILAGVAVANEWKEVCSARGEKTEILFVGAHGGIEEKLVPKNGYPLELLHLGSLNRVKLSRKLKTYFQLPLSLAKSVSILLKVKPQAVLGVGGYASGPLVLVAQILSSLGLLKCTTAILEQNSIPGFTNRILGRFVQKIFCAFPGSETVFPQGKAVITGNPIRSTLTRMASAPRSPFTVFVFGGSQGAVGINSLVLEALPLVKEMPIQWIHQTGEKDYDRVVQGYAQAGVQIGVQARIEKFVYEMPQAYAQASLLVCRAGSGTLSEIASVGRAAVLIPFPFASDDHQQKNAEVFAADGNAFVMRQLGPTAAKGADLAKIILDLMTHPEKLTKIESSVTRFHRPNAAKDIVKELFG